MFFHAIFNGGDPKDTLQEACVVVIKIRRRKEIGVGGTGDEICGQAPAEFRSKEK